MKNYLLNYLSERPLFLSLIRAKEAVLWQEHKPFKGRVLDLGCGDGFFARVVFGKIQVGLDVADSRIDAARSETGVYKEIVVYDGHKIPFANGSFDTVVSNCVMEHIPNIEEVIKETYRILKPGGKLITTVMARPWETNLAGALLFGHAYKAWMKRKQVHFNLLNSSEWQQLFERSGFKTQEVIGYLSEEACKLIDVCHYISLPSLVTKTLFGKWVMWPTSVYPTDWLVKKLTPNVDPSVSGALFFTLVKPGAAHSKKKSF